MLESIGSLDLSACSFYPSDISILRALLLPLIAVASLHCSIFKVQVVGSSGLEPPTSRLSGVRSNHLSYAPMVFKWLPHSFPCGFRHGGDEEDRTPDPLLAKQVLSQLSYTPDKVVGLGRLELPTSRLSGVRSNHLSYKPLNFKDLSPVILV